MTITADVLDDFNRVNEDPLSQGGNWNNFPPVPFRLVSNNAIGGGGGSGNANGVANYLGISIGSTVQEAWCELGTVVPVINNAVFAYARMTFTVVPLRLNGYSALWVYNGVTQQVQLRKTVNNTDTVLATVNPFNMVTGDAIGIRVDTTRLEGWARQSGIWAPIPGLVATDASFTTGFPGMGSIANMPIKVFGGGVPFAPQIVRYY